MTPTTATKAELDNAVDCSTHPMTNDSKALIDGALLRVLDDDHFDGSAAVAATGDITVVATTPAVAATGTIAINVSINFSGESVTIDGNVLTEGSEWTKGATNITAAASLATAINNLANFDAVPDNADVNITASDAGVAGNVACSTTKPSLINVPATLTSGADFIGPAVDDSIIVNYDGGSITLIAKLVENLGSLHFKTGDVDNTDSTFHTDIATSIKNVIANDGNFTAEVTNNVVTASQAVAGEFAGAITSSAGTITVDGNFANGENAVAQVTAGTNEILVRGQGSAGNTRNKVKLAINGAGADADVVYGSDSFLSIEEGIDGYNAKNAVDANKIKLEAEEVGAFTIGTLLADLTTFQTNTGTAATGAISIPLSNLDQPNNPFTITESNGGAGDFRKFLFHILQKYADYLATLEAVDTIVPTAGSAGTNYLADEVITITGGGGSGATAKIATVGGSGEVLTCTVLTGGSGYTTTPSGAITTASGSGCSLTIALETESPVNMTLAAANLIAIDDTTATKSFTAQFNFSIIGMDVTAE